MGRGYLIYSTCTKTLQLDQNSEKIDFKKKFKLVTLPILKKKSIACFEINTIPIRYAHSHWSVISLIYIDNDKKSSFLWIEKVSKI